jgi:multidrug efflux pump subunit AcrA (membrane-fusion protein)
MKLLTSPRTYIALAGGIIVTVVALNVLLARNTPEERIIATVDTGTVRDSILVSGVLEAQNEVLLGFNNPGIIAQVAVQAGDEVAEGQLLASLTNNSYAADRAEAVAGLARAEAARDELLAGPTDSTRQSITDTVAQSELNLTNTRRTQAEAIAAARRTLLSTDLVAVTVDPEETVPAPMITGTYRCQAEGSYNLEVYRSGSDTGYSVRYSGLESGTFVVSFTQPVSFGSCGLRAQFTAGGRYGNSDWLIAVPNQEGARYIQNRNALEIAITAADTAVSNAEQALALANSQATAETITARPETIARANADVASARARVARTDALNIDRQLFAPFAGTISDINTSVGEAVTTAPILTLVGTGTFTMSIRVPELDVSRIRTGQQARMVFDTNDEEVLLGRVDFISLSPTVIDGVAYYEATITMNERPDWLRSGLNADVELIIKEVQDALRLPSRFVIDDTVITVLPDNTLGSTSVTTILRGTDGYTAITGIPVRTSVVAP